MRRRSLLLFESILVGVIVAIISIVFMVAVLANSATSQRVLHLPVFTVLHPSQSVVRNWRMDDTGLVYVRWRLAATPSTPSKPIPLFNHFVKHDQGGQISLNASYYSYLGNEPALQLSLGWQQIIKTNRFAIRPWVRGRWYTIVAFWRLLPGGKKTEAGIFLDGKLVGHVVVPRVVFNRNDFPIRIGAEKTCSLCIDPSFPSVHWVDGQIEFAIWSLK